MSDANHQQEILAGFLAILAGSFWAYVRRLVGALEAVPFIKARVERVEAEMANHFKEAAVLKEAYIRDVASIKAAQEQYRDGHDRILHSIEVLNHTVSTFHSDLTDRIDRVVGLGL
jgi:hypothetical protein